jgi:hypothetical protein
MSYHDEDDDSAQHIKRGSVLIPDDGNVRGKVPFPCSLAGRVSQAIFLTPRSFASAGANSGSSQGLAFS